MKKHNAKIWWKDLRNIDFADEYADRIRDVAWVNKDTEEESPLEFESWYKDSEEAYTPSTSKKDLWTANNYEILKNICDRYDEARRAKRELLDEYNWWKWYPKDSDIYKTFNKKLENINNTLKEIESWKELKELFSSIKEVWLWDKWNKWFTAEMWQTLYQIKNKVWSTNNKSSMFSFDKFKWYSSIDEAMKKFNLWTTKNDRVDKEWGVKNNENKDEWTPSNDSPLNWVSNNVSPIWKLNWFKEYLSSKGKK